MAGVKNTMTRGSKGGTFEMINTFDNVGMEGVCAPSAPDLLCERYCNTVSLMDEKL